MITAANAATSRNGRSVKLRVYGTGTGTDSSRYQPSDTACCSRAARAAGPNGSGAASSIPGSAPAARPATNPPIAGSGERGSRARRPSQDAHHRGGGAGGQDGHHDEAQPGGSEHPQQRQPGRHGEQDRRDHDGGGAPVLPPGFCVRRWSSPCWRPESPWSASCGSGSRSCRRPGPQQRAGQFVGAAGRSPTGPGPSWWRCPAAPRRRWRARPGPGRSSRRASAASRPARPSGEY